MKHNKGKCTLNVIFNIFNKINNTTDFKNALCSEF